MGKNGPGAPGTTNSFAAAVVSMHHFSFSSALLLLLFPYSFVLIYLHEVKYRYGDQTYQLDKDSDPVCFRQHPRQIFDSEERGTHGQVKGKPLRIKVR